MENKAFEIYCYGFEKLNQYNYNILFWGNSSNYIGSLKNKNYYFLNPTF